MGVILQVAAKFLDGAQKVTVPAPSDKSTPKAPWWWDHLAMQAHDFARSGFTALLLPPVIKTQSGDQNTGDGYGPYDDYDLGNKLQVGAIPTRFGNRDALQRLGAIMRANGLDMYLDMVLHQRMGGNKYTYRYIGANGVPNVGRFPKNPDCFFPQVSRDPVPDAPDDFGFGDELCPVNAKPHDYVALNLIAAGNWATRALDARGYRIDDTKGIATQFLHRYLTSGAMANGFAVGEYFDGNPDSLNWWVWQSGMQGRASTFDFGIRFTLADMCNNSSRFDMRRLHSPNYISRDPSRAVSFVENHDTDLSEPLIWNKILGYAFILTREGYPCVYYKDYSTDAGCYGLKKWIDNLVWIHERFANGSTVIRDAQYQYIVYERTGYAGKPGCLVGLNNDMYSGWTRVTVQTSFGPNAHLHDYTGNSNDVWTDGNGNATIWLPPNNNGHGYVVFARTGQNEAIVPEIQTTTQVFEGAPDLDIAGAFSTSASLVCNLFIKGGTVLYVKREMGPQDLQIFVKSPGGLSIPSMGADSTAAEVSFHITLTDTYTVLVQKMATSALPSAFRFAMTYQAPQTL